MTGNDRVLDENEQLAAGHVKNRRHAKRDQKCKANPKPAVVKPPLNDSGPSKPLAIHCKIRTGRRPIAQK